MALASCLPQLQRFRFPWDAQGKFCWFLRIPKVCFTSPDGFLGSHFGGPMKFVCETMGIPEHRWLTFMERIWEMFGKIWCLVFRSISLFGGLEKSCKLCQRCSKDADSSCGVVDPCLENLTFRWCSTRIENITFHHVQWYFPTNMH